MGDQDLDIEDIGSNGDNDNDRDEEEVLDSEGGGSSVDHNIMMSNTTMLTEEESMLHSGRSSTLNLLDRHSNNSIVHTEQS